MAPSRGHKLDDLGPSSPIPDKLYFKIGEVAKLVGVQAHVLRYWQSEIPAIRPSKSASNQRRYRYKDVEIFREIRRLLYDERYTLAGARRRVLSRESSGSAELDGGASDAGRAQEQGEPADVARQRPPPGPVLAEAPTPRAEVVPLVTPAPARARGEAATGERDDDAVARLRRGLKELIRLAGEEP